MFVKKYEHIKQSVPSDWEEYVSHNNREKVQKSLNDYLEKIKDQPQPQLHHHYFVFKNYINSELTKDEFTLLADEYAQDNINSRNNGTLMPDIVPDEFDFVMAGNQRKLINSFTFDSKNAPIVDATENQAHKQNILSKVEPQFLKAAEALQEWEKKRIENIGITGNIQEKFQMSLIEGASFIVNVTLLNAPQFVFVPRPQVLTLKHPVFTNDVLIITKDRAKKRELKKYFETKALPFEYSITFQEKYEKRLATSAQLRKELSDIYDMVFIDRDVSEMEYSLEDKLYDSLFVVHFFFTQNFSKKGLIFFVQKNRNHPIILPAKTEDWISFMEKYYLGMPITVPRGIKDMFVSFLSKFSSKSNKIFSQISKDL